MQDSIFTKIAKGELPSEKIYEDERTVAILDIFPKTDGHVLVFPRAQIESVWDLSDDDYKAVMNTSRKVAERLKQVFKPRYIGEQIVGIDVPHAHVHLIPFNNVEEFKRSPDRNIKPDLNHLSEVAKKLRFT